MHNPFVVIAALVITLFEGIHHAQFSIFSWSW